MSACLFGYVRFVQSVRVCLSIDPSLCLCLCRCFNACLLIFLCVHYSMSVCLPLSIIFLSKSFCLCLSVSVSISLCLSFLLPFQRNLIGYVCVTVSVIVRLSIIRSSFFFL